MIVINDGCFEVLRSTISRVRNSWVEYFSFRKKKLSKVELINFRCSHPDVFCEKGVLRNFAKFTGKHLCQSLFFNKVAEKRDSGTGVFL